MINYNVCAQLGIVGRTAEVSDILHSGRKLGFAYLDKPQGASLSPESAVHTICTAIKASFPMTIYASKKDMLISITIEAIPAKLSKVIVQPIEGFRLKQDPETHEQLLDLAFYTNLTLDLCKDYALYGLYTEKV